jgi:hypothetical protein
MRTPLEALFDAMVTGGWANESTGDVESPTGHFARISNAPNELSEIRQAFDDTLTTYGNVSDEDMTGHFLVVTDSQGFIHIHRFDSETALVHEYRNMEADYADWSADDSEGDSESAWDAQAEALANMRGLDPNDPEVWTRVKAETDPNGNFN